MNLLSTGSKILLAFSIIVFLFSGLASAAPKDAPQVKSVTLYDENRDNVFHGDEDLKFYASVSGDPGVKSVNVSLTNFNSSQVDLVNETASGYDWNNNSNLETSVFGANLSFDSSGVSNGFVSLKAELNVTDNSSYSNSTVYSFNKTFVYDSGNPGSGGSGTVSDPYEISSVYEIASIGASPGAHYELVSNIDAGGNRIVPAESLSGTLNGNGYKISNYRVREAGEDVEAGLIREIDGGTVKNLEIKNFSVEGGEYVGGLAGSVLHDVTIKNVNFTGKVSGDGSGGSPSNVGGLIGRASGFLYMQNYNRVLDPVSLHVENVWGSVNVSSKETAGGVVAWAGRPADTNSKTLKLEDVELSRTSIDGSNAGGVLGFIGVGNLSVKSFRGRRLDINGDDHSGAVLGIATKYSSNQKNLIKVIDSSVENTSVDAGSSAGGFIGYSKPSIKIKDSIFQGDVNENQGDSSATGGLVGFFGGYYGVNPHLVIENSSSDGLVSGEMSGGGLVGFSQENLFINSSHSTAKVTAEGEYNKAGGLVGHQTGGNGRIRIFNSYFNGSVRTKSKAAGAGIIGGFHPIDKSLAIKNVTNYGDVKASGLAGGIAALLTPRSDYKPHETLKLYNLANYGKINSTDQKAGGLVAQISSLYQSVRIRDSVNYGRVDGEKQSYDGTGGAVGEIGIESGPVFEARNLTNYAKVTSDDRKTAGLFGAAYLTVKNNSMVQLENYGDIANNGSDYAGGIAGQLVSTGKIRVEDFTNLANISGGSRVGGLIGAFYGSGTTFKLESLKMEDLRSIGNVKATSQGSYGYTHAGGLIGIQTAFGIIEPIVIKNITHRGNVSAKSKGAGGVFGGLFSSGGTLVLKNITSKGRINAGGKRVGGVSSFLYAQKLEISNISVSGKVNASGSWVGGIAGGLIKSGSYYSSGSGSLSMTNTEFKGDIKGQTSSDGGIGGLAGFISAPNIDALSGLKYQGEIDASGSGGHVGGIAGGLAMGSPDKKISDLTVRSNITSEAYRTGGIFGGVFGGNFELKDIHFQGNIEAENISRDSSHIGGIFGMLSGSQVNISDTKVLGDISSDRGRVGGLGGGFFAIDSYVRNISVFGDISAGEGYQNRSNAGGIFGITATGKDSIRKVSSYGKVSGTSNRVGGLIGAVFSNISVSQSLHYGSIKGGINDGISNTGGAFGIIASEKAVLKPFVFSIGRVTAPGSKVGGFAGSAYKNTEITYAFSWGNVSGGNYTGGMVGDSSYTNMTYSWSFGPVKGEKATGGLIGKDLNGSITEMNTKSQVKGEDMTGGIAGIAYGTRIRRVTAKGDVKGKTAVGGFIGKSLNNTSIKLAYARGNVTGTENVAGFIGNNTGNVSQAYSTGKISALTGPTKNSFGGFIGVNKGNVENSYWDRQLSGMQKSASQAEGLSTQQMKTRRHLDGFNFFKHWVLISGVNDGYAVLRPQQPPTPPLPPPEVCGDNADNDGDGEIDENCSGFLPPQPPNLPEICADSVDNDNNGKTDEGCGGDIPDPGQGSNKTGSGISLSWNDNSQTEEGFRLYSNVSGEFRQIGNAAANSKSFKPPALPAPASGRHVCYRVTAYNQFGESAYSQDCIN